MPLQNDFPQESSPLLKAAKQSQVAHASWIDYRGARTRHLNNLNLVENAERWEETRYTGLLWLAKTILRDLLLKIMVADWCSVVSRASFLPSCSLDQSASITIPALRPL